MKKIEKIHVIGLGALGIMYGKCAIDHMGKEAVSFIVDEERAKRYQDKTFTCNGEVCPFQIENDEQASPADLVIVAVKSTSLQSALDTMRTSVGPDTVILSVMNGISSEQIIGERYGHEKLIDTVAQGMDAMKFGDSLTFTRRGELHIGRSGVQTEENLEAVVDFMERSGLEYVVEEDIRYRMWGKFMLNVGINQTCMVYSTNYGTCLMEGEPNRIFISAMREVVAVANAEGIALGEKDINQYVKIIGTLAPDGTPSMGQDRILKRPSEVEMFAGTVIRLAKKHGIHVPVNAFLYKRVAEIEAEY